MKPLEPLKIPLDGRQLIEASAGTGKTYTIATLYLRLILESTAGASSGHRQGLTPEKILVVTFTEAATMELRDRIRKRLDEAAALFAGRLSEDQVDPTLKEIYASYPESHHKRCAWQLSISAAMMDRAGVHTIHAWCNKMLRKNAFLSRSLFDQEQGGDEGESIRTAVETMWRSLLYPLKKEQFDAIEEIYSQLKSPAEWLQALRPILALPDRELRFSRNGYRPSLHNNHNESRETLISLLIDPQREPNEKRLELLTFAAEFAEKQIALAKQLKASVSYDDMIRRLADVLLNEGRNGPLSRTLLASYPVAMIDEFQDTDPLQYQIFSSIYHDPEKCSLFLIGDPKQAIYSFRGADLPTYITARRETRPESLHTLDTNYRSSAELIAATNHLFSYGHQKLKSKGGLFLHEEIEFHPVKGRESIELLHINGDKSDGIDLFYIDQPYNAKADDETPVRLASGDFRKAASCYCADRIAEILQHAEEGRAFFDNISGAAKRKVAPKDIAILVRSRVEADLIRGELRKRQIRSVYLSDQESVYSSDEARDLVTILEAVASCSERAIRSALSLPSLRRTLSELNQLNESEDRRDEASALFQLLQRIWRRYGVLPLLQRLFHGLHLPGRLLSESDGGERSLTNLLHLSELLQSASYQLDGEQALIDHLRREIARASEGEPGEAQLRLESESELLRVVTIHKSKGLEYPLVFLPFAPLWREPKKTQLPQRYRNNDGAIVLDYSESAQGLSEARHDTLEEELRLLYVALTRARHYTWLAVAPVRSGNGKLPELEKGALGHILLGGKPLFKDEETKKKDFDKHQVRKTIEKISSRLHFDSIRFCKAMPPAILATGSRALSKSVAVPAAVVAEAREFRGSIDRSWSLFSYSSLLQSSTSESDEPTEWIGGERADGDGDGDGDSVSAALPESGVSAEAVNGEEESIPSPGDLSGRRLASPISLHHFYRGALAGLFLHGLLEWAAEHGFDQVAKANCPARRDQIARRCNRRTLTDWIDFFDQWLALIVQRPIRLPFSKKPLRLCDLGRGDQLAEMEFMLSARHLPSAKLDRLVAAAIYPERRRPAIEERQLRGMLRGFIDLTLCHEGKYYVADYKSNFLGSSEAAYNEEAMRKSLVDHRYDLQGVLYTLALHRLLKSRLGESYSYEKHVGGFLYLYLRGIESESHNNNHGVLAYRPDAELIETLDQMFNKEKQNA